jgi:DNA-binding CsgD family transcriptional regulator
MQSAVKGQDNCLPAIIFDLANAQDAPELVERFRTFIHPAGLGPFALAEIRSANTQWRENLILGTIPDSYFNEYFATKSLFDSPIFQTAQYACQPTPLSEVYNLDRLNRRGHKILQRASKYGLQDGYCFPLKGRDCRPTLMLIVGDFSAVEASALVILEMAVLAYYRRACALFPESTELGSHPQGELSDRERETLTWVAKGKTDWEIAQLLEISERTVHYHIENAKKKMMVPTRLQAVVEAIRTLEILI